MANKRENTAKSISYVLIGLLLIFATWQQTRISNLINTNHSYEKERKELLQEIEHQKEKQAEFQKILTLLKFRHARILKEYEKLKDDSTIKEEYEDTVNPIDTYDWDDIVRFLANRGIFSGDTIPERYGIDDE